jgi:acetyl-CoA acetyltransferase
VTDRTAVIAGVAESDAVGRVPEKTVLQLQAEAASNAVRDAGIDPERIDGLFAQGSGLRERYDFPTFAVAEYLGIEPTVASSNDLGGASAFGHVQYAMLAIEAGLLDAALVTYGSTNYTDRSEGRNQYPPKDPILTRQYEAPYGPNYPISAYAMAARRYMHDFDVTREDLAAVAVSTRKWAQRNPKAMMQDDLSVEDVLDSQPICTPLHKLDCCLVSDAGGALVLTSEAIARETAADGGAAVPPPVEIPGLAQTQTHEHLCQMPDLTLPGAHRTAADAYDQAGLSPDDVDVAELYDSFTITTALLTESVGLADRGAGTAPFVAGETAPGGEIPINTSGGGLSYLHPGTYGIFTIVEAVRQVRGDYAAAGADERQVEDATVGLAHGTGGVLSAHATMLLRCDGTREQAGPPLDRGGVA